ncbi:hypothetical protein ASE60_10855 [Ensifer sp. Root278]|nr:hypothetical protein ASE60_10855 [Ensifer sp. Root278]
MVPLVWQKDRRMDLATIVIVDTVLREGGIRRAATLSGRAPSSVSAAIKRFEQAISMSLFRREETALVLTLEARARTTEIREATTKIAAIMEAAGKEAIDPTPPIGLVALDRFVRIARSGSIRATAKALGLGQPQLTRQMADLERHLGSRLFERSHGGVLGTATAERIIPFVDALLDIWARLTHASADRFRRDAATWRLGAVMPLGPESEIARMLAALTANWQRTRPRQPLYISSTTADELLAGLRSRRFDAALLDVAEIPLDCDGRLVSQMPLALAGPASVLSAFAGDLPRLLAACPIAVPSVRSGLRRETARFLDDTLDETERRRIALVEVDSIPVIINLVAQHGYLSVLPESSLARMHRPPAMIRLGPAYRQSLTLVWPRGAFAGEIGELMISMMKASPRA